MPFAALHDRADRPGWGGNAQLSQTRDDPGLPLAGQDRAELVEAAELAERAPPWAEQVAHQMLHAAGEQDADLVGALQLGAQLLGEHVGVAEALRCDVLKLV